jgi:hypothetical protein
LDGEEEDMVDGAYGTLTIGAEGEARFVGSFAGSEYLREGEDRNGESPEEQVEASISLRTPPAAARKEWHEHTQALHLEARPANGGLPLDAILPYGRGDSVDIESLREQLPDWCLEGRVLVESYWYNVNWM